MRQSPRDLIPVELPDGRMVLVSEEFLRAAQQQGQPAQSRFEHGSRALWDTVINSEGKVDFHTARQFLESYHHKYFQRNRGITDPRARESLGSLGFETVINLYEAMAKVPMRDNSLYLDMLNRAIDLSKEEVAEWTRPIRDFYAPENRSFIEQRWELAKRKGLISTAEGTFADTIAQNLAEPELITEGGYHRRKAILQFISDAYSDFANEEHVLIEYVKGPPGLGALHTVDERTGQHVVALNVDNFAFQFSFMFVMNAIHHERYHASDRMLGDKYEAGEIKKGDPEYKRARIAAAGMSRFGYISGHARAGQIAYREQVVEVGAHHAGKIAEYMTHTQFANEPDPLISLRDDWDKHSLADEYKNMTMRRAQMRYPRGFGPFGSAGERPVMAMA